MDIKGLVWEGMDWFHLVQDSNKWWPVVSIFCRPGHCVASFRGIAASVFRVPLLPLIWRHHILRKVGNHV